MIQEIGQIQETDNHHMEPLNLDHLYFHDHVINFVPNTVIVVQISNLTELHNVQDARSRILCTTKNF